jgi:hypothetical protein
VESRTGLGGANLERHVHRQHQIGDLHCTIAVAVADALDRSSPAHRAQKDGYGKGGCPCDLSRQGISHAGKGQQFLFAVKDS